jgi:hypothetical protein
VKVPVVLSTVHVEISTDGQVLVDIDGVPYAAERQLGRSELRSIIGDITTELGTAVRVEVRESDGTSYYDIATPPETESEGRPAAAGTAPQPGLHGKGFRPGEQVAVAYVLCTQTAGADGQASVRLPPTLLTRTGHRVVLIGMSSAAVAEIEQPA